MSRLMTLKEIAQQMNAPESSVRKYREIFSSFIPSVGTGRSRRYRSEAVDIIKDIRHMREELHMPWDAITDHLADKYPIDATPAVQAPGDGDDDAQGHGDSGVQHAVQSPVQQFRQVLTQTQANHPAAVQADPQFMQKVLAISEKQTMMINAIAMELLRALDQVKVEVRAEARHENAVLQKNVAGIIGSLSGTINVMGQQERALLRELKGDIAKIEQTIEKMSVSGEKAALLPKLQEQVKLARQKLEQQDLVIQEYKKSFDVIKKENTELREFKLRHIERSEERTREAKAQKSATGIRKLFSKKSDY